MANIKELMVARDKRKAELAALEAAIEMAKDEEMPFDQRLAVCMHDAMCTHNHIDACGWQYEITNGEHLWGNDSHKWWLKIATKTLSEVEPLRVEPKVVLSVFQAYARAKKAR